MNAPPDAGIGAADQRLVVRRHPEFEFGLKLKFLREHLPRRHHIVTGQLFQQSLIEPHSLIRFDGCDQTRTLQSRNVRGRRIAGFRIDHDRLRLDIGCVVAENAAHDLQKCGFTVSARAEQEECTLLRGRAGQGIPDALLDVIEHIRIAAENIREEREPQLRLRCIGIVDHRALLGQIRLSVMRQQLAGFQVDDTVFRTDHRLVPVEILREDRRIVLCFADHVGLAGETP